MKKLLLYLIVSSFLPFFSMGQTVSAQTNKSCLKGPGYWKNHSACQSKGNKRNDTWDLIKGYDKNGNESSGEQTIFFKSKQNYCEVFDTNPGKGGKYYILAHKYITVQLNILATPNTVDTDNVFGESTTFLNTYTPEEIKSSKKLQRESVKLSSELASFSNRLNCDDIENPIIGVLADPVNIKQNSLTLNWTAASDNVAVTNYRIYKDGVLEQEVGNVLTYDVTGLNPVTLYSFYMTALDEAGNESAKSNSIQVSTLQSPTGSTLSLTTVSKSKEWSPKKVANSGTVLKWTAASNGFYMGETIVANDPEFNFEKNNGTPIEITVTSEDDFAGLTQLDFWNNNGTGSEITQLNVSDAHFLNRLNTRYNLLTEIDVSQNTELNQLVVRGNSQLSSGTLDISNNPLLTYIQADVTQLNWISLKNNKVLIDVRLYNTKLSSSVLDQILIDLDNHGLKDGNLEIRGNPGILTTSSLTAYNSLISKGWTIDVDAPVANKIATSKIDIYPNPVYEAGAVSFKSTSSGFAEVKLYGSSGQAIGTLFSGETLKDEDYTIEYDLNQLEQGMYFALFKIGNETIRKKILITK